MRTLIVALVVAGSSALAAAQELIQNPSFEQASGCPTGPAQLSLAEPWIAPTLGTADYFSSCNTEPDSVGVPDNQVGSQGPYSGDAYAGFIALSPTFGDVNYREYLQAPLIGAGLEAGKTYRFSMHLCLAEDSSAATDRIGAYFSTTAVGTGDSLPLAFTPQLETPAGTFLADALEWMSFTDTFVAAGSEQHVTIGNFHDAASSATTPAGSGPVFPLQLGSAYYYVDVVSLQCEPCTEPPDDMVAWWPLDESEGALAQDVVGAQDGVHVDGPVPLPGFVDHALDFLASAVSVATTPALELGTGDFSLDAWVRPAALGTAQALLAKIPPADPPTGPGYALTLESDGTIRFLMVDASLGSATGSSTAALEPGAWSHVTVTVDRDDPGGGRIHVDGTLASFDPTPAAGSLSNGFPLVFARDGVAGLAADLLGMLDEIELFHRALTASEVLSLFQARTSGKCKVVFDLPPVIPIPVTPGTLVTTPTLTNSTGSTGTFSVSVYAEPAGTRSGALVSTLAGPPNPVVLTAQPILVAPGASALVQLELDTPSGMQSGDIACYSVATTHLETGRTFVSRGALRGRFERRRLLPAPAPLPLRAE